MVSVWHPDGHIHGFTAEHCPVVTTIPSCNAGCAFDAAGGVYQILTHPGRMALGICGIKIIHFYQLYGLLGAGLPRLLRDRINGRQ